MPFELFLIVKLYDKLKVLFSLFIVIYFLESWIKTNTLVFEFTQGLLPGFSTLHIRFNYKDHFAQKYRFIILSNNLKCSYSFQRQDGQNFRLNYVSIAKEALKCPA